MVKSFSIEITCPLHRDRKYKVNFEPLSLTKEFFCIGCDEFRDDNSICMKCRNDMQALHGGESPIDKQLKEISQVAQEK